MVPSSFRPANRPDFGGTVPISELKNHRKAGRLNFANFDENMTEKNEIKKAWKNFII